MLKRPSTKTIYDKPFMKPCYNNEKEEWIYIQICFEPSKNYQNVVPSVTNEVGSLFPGLAALPQVNSIIALLLSFFCCKFSPIFSRWLPQHLESLPHHPAPPLPVEVRFKADISTCLTRYNHHILSSNFYISRFNITMFQF